MSDLPSTTLELAARAVLSHPWGSGPWSAHSEHRFDIECAVCQGDVRRVLAVALAAVTDHAHQLASSHGGEHDALRQRYAEAVRSVAIRLTPNPTTTAMLQVYAPFHLTDVEARPIADAVLAVRDAELERLRARVAELELTARVSGGLYRSAERDVTAAEAANARVRDLADRLAREPHPTHDHLCPDGVRAELLAALDGPAAVSEQVGSGKQLPANSQQLPALGATTTKEGA